MSVENVRWAVGLRWADEGQRVALLVGDVEMTLPWDVALAMAGSLEAMAYVIRPDLEPEEAPNA